MAASKGCRKLSSQISILSILHAVVPREIKDNAYATIFFFGGGGGGVGGGGVNKVYYGKSAAGVANRI